MCSEPNEGGHDLLLNQDDVNLCNEKIEKNDIMKTIKWS